PANPSIQIGDVGRVSLCSGPKTGSVLPGRRKERWVNEMSRVLNNDGVDDVRLVAQKRQHMHRLRLRVSGALLDDDTERVLKCAKSRATSSGGEFDHRVVISPI